MSDLEDAIGDEEEIGAAEPDKKEVEDAMIIDTEKKEAVVEKNESVASEEAENDHEESGKVVKAGKSLITDPEEKKKRKVTW